VDGCKPLPICSPCFICPFITLPFFRGLDSFTFQLKLSALYGIGGARRCCVPCVKGVLGGVYGVWGVFLCQTRLKLS